MGPDGAQAAVGVADTRVMSMDLFLDDDAAPVTWRHPGGLAADTFVWRGSLEANVLREFLADTSWGTLDFLFIDMPPGADRFETLMRLVPDLSGALVVTIPSRVSYLVVRRAIAAARQAGARLLGLVENMADLFEENGEGVGELFHDRDGASLAAEMDLPSLGRVPFDARLARATDGGRPFVLQYGDTPAGRAILTLAQELEEVLQE